MKNHTKIRVVYAKNPPDEFSNCQTFPTLTPSLACPFPGWCLEILSMLVDYQHLEIEPVIVDNKVGSLDWGTLLPNDTWTGVLGYLQNDIADTACLMYQLTLTRGQYYSPSYPVYNVQPIYAVKQTLNNGPGLWSVFAPYQLWTWLAIIGTFFIESIYFLFVAKLEFKMFRRKIFQPYEILWNLVRLQVDRERSRHHEHFHSKGGNLNVFLFSMLHVRVILDLYTGSLLSSLFLASTSTAFTNVDQMIDLIASGQYKLVTNYIGNWYFDDLKYSNDTHYVKLRAATANNPVVVVDSVNKALDYVENGKYIYPIQIDSLANQMSKGRCNLVYITEGLPQVQAMFMFQQNSSFLPNWNKAIYENGDFIERTFNKYFMNGYLLGFENLTCLAEKNTPNALRPLDLYASFAIFLIAMFGFAVSIVAFGFEIYFNWQRKIIDQQINMKKAALLMEPFHMIKLAKIIEQRNSKFNA